MVTVLRHAKLLCMNDSFDYFEDGFVSFDQNGIIDFGEDKAYSRLSFSDISVTEVDVKGDIVMPAFINCHTHLGMVSFRSLGDDVPDRLNRFLFPLEDQCMTKELVYASSRLAMAELLLSGTASALDMYYFEEEVIKAAGEMNLRLWAGETILDKKHCDAPDFNESLKKLESLLSYRSDMINIVASPHAPYSVSLDNLKRVKDFASSNSILWSMHVAEMLSENKQSREKFNCSPIRYLLKNNLLDENLIAGHCIYTDKEDISFLADSHFSVCHCPVSNAKAAKGVAPVYQMMKGGINVTLGTDGPSSGNTLDMFTQLKSCVILQKNLLQDRSIMSAKETLSLCTRNAGFALKIKAGQIQKGFKADLIVLDTKQCNMIPVHDVYSAVVYSAQSHNVKDVWVNSKLTVQNHELVSTDISALISDFNQASKDFNILAKKRAQNL